MEAPQGLKESFQDNTLNSRLTWYCPPPAFHCGEGKLVLETAANTDYWQRTHYGFQVDNGHFLYTNITGDFVMTTKVAFHPVHQYDQAGLMVRLSSSCWLKTSIEFEPHGPCRLGAVVTNFGYSDWSTQDVEASVRQVELRVRREATDYIVEARLPGQESFSQLRIAHLHDDQQGQPVQAGLYACSPQGAGYKAEFSVLDIKPGRLGSSHQN